MIVAVGSLNQVKIRAVAAVLRRVWPNAEVAGVDGDPGVPAQPHGDDEAIAGAVARARFALARTDADLGVGLEGGVSHLPIGTFTNAWCAIITRAGEVSVGGSVAMPLPPRVNEKLAQGWELGDAMDELTGMKDTKKRMGAVGILTNGLLDRERAYQTIVVYALARHLHPEWYAEARTGEGSD
jgi:inosine/xanthosine triphosphatase